MPMYPTRSDEEHARITADYLLDGIATQAKRIVSTNTFKFLKGLSKEFGRLEDTINTFASGWNITKTSQFVEEWEKTQGIPDNEFPATGGSENRRKQAHAKLAAEGLSTKDDIEWLLSLLGWEVVAYPGYYFILNPDPRVPTFSSDKEARFTLVVEVFNSLSDPTVVPQTFPIPFPWVFGLNHFFIAQNFLRTIIDANVQLVWIFGDGTGATGYGYFPYGISAYGQPGDSPFGSGPFGEGEFGP